MLGVAYPHTSLAGSSLDQRLREGLGVGNRELGSIRDGRTGPMVWRCRRPSSTYTVYYGVDRPQSMKRAGTRYNYLRDLQGHMVAVTDSAGSIKSASDYTPYGETLLHASAPLRLEARALYLR